MTACTRSSPGGAAGASSASAVDSGLVAFIGSIRAVDNHAHVNSIDPDDGDADALHIEKLPEFSFPARLRPDNPDWLAAYRALYDYPYADLAEPHMTELRATMERVRKEKGEAFPAWVLDRIGTEVMLGNRIEMGPGLSPPRFRWVSYVDALMLPLSTTDERARRSTSTVSSGLFWTWTQAACEQASWPLSVGYFRWYESLRGTYPESTGGKECSNERERPSPASGSRWLLWDSSSELRPVRKSSPRRTRRTCPRRR